MRSMDLPRQGPSSRLPVFPFSHSPASRPAPPAGQSGSASRKRQATQGSHVRGSPAAPAGGALPDNHGAGTLSNLKSEISDLKSSPESDPSSTVIGKLDARLI